ncbi:MAG: hypothetical protein M3040_12775, partial [Bacteroidota bacterium]|nr:hypothetical protein [Bacteroidota bacterium]
PGAADTRLATKKAVTVRMLPNLFIFIWGVFLAVNVINEQESKLILQNPYTLKKPYNLSLKGE